MYLTSSYFVGELFIPNITGTTNPEKANFSNLMNFILKYEAKFLEMLLGEDFYDEFVSGMGEDPVPDKWTDLYNQIYKTETQTVGTTTYTLYISPAANYVYYQYMKNKQTVTMMSGEAKQANENATNVINLNKMVSAYSLMKDMVEDIWEWLEDNSDTYDTFNAGETDRFLKINQMNI